MCERRRVRHSNKRVCLLLVEMEKEEEREWETERGECVRRISKKCVFVFVLRTDKREKVCVRMCVCVKERKREREKGRDEKCGRFVENIGFIYFLWSRQIHRCCSKYKRSLPSFFPPLKMKFFGRLYVTSKYYEKY